MTGWAEQRRADRAAAREQARLDADAASARRIRERAAAAELAESERGKRAGTRRAARAELSAWASAHVVDLLVYPLAVASAVMAVPAMARYGHGVYGGATGYVLPVLSELGMWAFALAVMAARRADPPRPAGMLTGGVAVFAAVGAGLNFAHGLDTGGAADAAVMAVVSVAGVVAHQLAVACPPRTRLARLAARRVARARRAATRAAGVELAADGAAALVYTPGRYVVARGRRLAPDAAGGAPGCAAPGAPAGAAEVPARGVAASGGARPGLVVRPRGGARGVRVPRAARVRRHSGSPTGGRTGPGPGGDGLIPVALRVALAVAPNGDPPSQRALGAALRSPEHGAHRLAADRVRGLHTAVVAALWPEQSRNGDGGGVNATLGGEA